MTLRRTHTMNHSSTASTRAVRPLVRPLLVACALVVAGCSGTLVEYAASPASIPDAALEPRGYAHTNTTQLPLTYRVGGASFSRDLTVQTWVSGYVQTTENETSVLVLHSSPDVGVANRSVNPASQLSNREVVGFVLERVVDLQALGGLENVSELSERGVRNVTVLGTPTQMASYAGTAEVDGQRAGVVVNVAVVEHEGDVVVAVGVHSESVDESPAHAALVEEIEHG